MPICTSWIVRGVRVDVKQMRVEALFLGLRAGGLEVDDRLPPGEQLLRCTFILEQPRQERIVAEFGRLEREDCGPPAQHLISSHWVGDWLHREAVDIAVVVIVVVQELSWLVVVGVPGIEPGSCANLARTAYKAAALPLSYTPE